MQIFVFALTIPIQRTKEPFMLFSTNLNTCSPRALVLDFSRLVAFCSPVNGLFRWSISFGAPLNIEIPFAALSIPLRFCGYLIFAHNDFTEDFFIQSSFPRILRQISVTELLLCALDLACLRKNESLRFTKRIFRGAV